MRTRKVCGECFVDVDGEGHVDLWPADLDYHEPRPITVRVCEAGTCERLADVISNGRAFCSGHACEPWDRWEWPRRLAAIARLSAP